MAPFRVNRSGGDRRSCARPCAGGTPALPGGRHSVTSLLSLKAWSDGNAAQPDVRDHLTFFEVHPSPLCSGPAL